MAAPKAPLRRKPRLPTAAQHAAELGKPPMPVEPGLFPASGSDFMVDVLKALGIEYVFANTAQSFKGLQESVVNYGNNQAPEFITCNHEESSVGMAHGYAKASGQAGGDLLSRHRRHAACGDGGLQRVLRPRAGGCLPRQHRSTRPTRANATEWRHSAQDPAAFVRDFTKWDDQPISLQGISRNRWCADISWRSTPPMAPVCISTDFDLQERWLCTIATSWKIPKITPISPPAGDSGAVREAARLLVAANNPVILAGHLARTPAGMKSLIELAELLNAPVIDQGDRQNFPNYALTCAKVADGQKLVRGADVVLGLELTDLWGSVNHARGAAKPRTKIKAGAKVIGIGANDHDRQSQLSVVPALSSRRRSHRSHRRRRGDVAGVDRSGEIGALTADRKNAIAAVAPTASAKAHAAA